jgi:hypothetical protein
MTVTNKAINEQINLATVLNTKLELPILQNEMGLNLSATAAGHAVRWDEFSLKHNNDGTFKGIDQADVNLTTSATTTKKPVRWDEFSSKHNNDGTFKIGIVKSADIGTDIANSNISVTAAIAASKLSIQKNYKKSTVANPSATIDAYGTVVDLLPTTGYIALNPMAIDVVFGGTFGVETATANITVTYSDATTATVTKTATAIGTTSFTNADLMALIKDGVYINKVQVKSKSNIASSTVTSTFNHYGFYL